MSKESVLRNSIIALKESYGLTGVKVELEANLNRRGVSEVNCDECNGSTTCDTCSGDGTVRCSDCNGNGWISCDECDGRGHVDHPQDSDRTVDCVYCDGEGDRQCGTCSGDEYVTCDDCDGSGINVCSRQHEPRYNWGQVGDCHDFVLSKLVEHGLAERVPDGVEMEGYRRYRPVMPLVFSRFYNDGSVDSEWTFTLSTEDPDSVLKLPLIVGAFNQLAEAIGNGMDVGGAGMHTALLHGEDAYYPVDTRTSTNMRRFENFRRSMGLLLPALYFLGTANENSRRLNYRPPQIELDKYSAVTFRGGALEFRVFDTCYETPEAILDNLVVMANCVNKYWKDTFVPTGLREIASQIDFGIEEGNKLERFYVKYEHLDLLNAGLKLIKPSYYTVTEVKKQRKFGVTKRTLTSRTRKAEKDVQTEYKEYEQRHDWSDKIRKHYEVGSFLEANMSELIGLPESEQLERALAWVERHHRPQNKQSLETYVRARLDEIRNSQQGRWVLRGE